MPIRNARKYHGKLNALLEKTTDIMKVSRKDLAKSFGYRDAKMQEKFYRYFSLDRPIPLLEYVVFDIFFRFAQKDTFTAKSLLQDAICGGSQLRGYLKTQADALNGKPLTRLLLRYHYDIGAAEYYAIKKYGLDENSARGLEVKTRLAWLNARLKSPSND